jgi:hypothetical protein
MYKAENRAFPGKGDTNLFFKKNKNYNKKYILGKF